MASCRLNVRQKCNDFFGVTLKKATSADSSAFHLWANEIVNDDHDDFHFFSATKTTPSTILHFYYVLVNLNKNTSDDDFDKFIHLGVVNKNGCGWRATPEALISLLLLTRKFLGQRPFNLLQNLKKREQHFDAKVSDKKSEEGSYLDNAKCVDIIFSVIPTTPDAATTSSTLITGYGNYDDSSFYASFPQEFTPFINFSSAVYTTITPFDAGGGGQVTAAVVFTGRSLLHLHLRRRLNRLTCRWWWLRFSNQTNSFSKIVSRSPLQGDHKEEEERRREQNNSRTQCTDYISFEGGRKNDARFSSKLVFKKLYENAFIGNASPPPSPWILSYFVTAAAACFHPPSNQQQQYQHPWQRQPSLNYFCRNHHYPVCPNKEKRSRHQRNQNCGSTQNTDDNKKKKEDEGEAERLRKRRREPRLRRNRHFCAKVLLLFFLFCVPSSLLSVVRAHDHHHQATFYLNNNNQDNSSPSNCCQCPWIFAKPQLQALLFTFFLCSIFVTSILIMYQEKRSYSRKSEHKREGTGAAAGAGSDYHHIQANGGTGPFITSPPPSVRNGSLRNESNYQHHQQQQHQQHQQHQQQRSSSASRVGGGGDYASESHYVRGAGGQLVPISGDRYYDQAVGYSHAGAQGFSESSSYETREHYERKIRKKTRGERERSRSRGTNGLHASNGSLGGKKVCSFRLRRPHREERILSDHLKF